MCKKNIQLVQNEKEEEHAIVFGKANGKDAWSMSGELCPVLLHRHARLCSSGIV